MLVEPVYTRTSFDENLIKPDRELKLYEPTRAAVNSALQHAIGAGDAPEIVAEVVLKAAAARVPKRRYTAGKLARRVSLLRRFAPESVFDTGLRKQNGPPA